MKKEHTLSYYDPLTETEEWVPYYTFVYQSHWNEVTAWMHIELLNSKGCWVPGIASVMIITHGIRTVQDRDSLMRVLQIDPNSTYDGDGERFLPCLPRWLK